MKTKKKRTKLLVWLLTLMMLLSSVGCGEESAQTSKRDQKVEKETTNKKDKDKDNEDEEEGDEEKEEEKDDKKDSSKEKEEFSLSKEDEEALEIVFDTVEYVFVDDMKDEKAFLSRVGEAREKLDGISKIECSTYMVNLIEEELLLINEMEELYEMVAQISEMEVSLDEISAKGDIGNLSDYTSLKALNEAYEIAKNRAEQLLQVECPQMFEYPLQKLSSLYMSYKAILAKQYFAVQNDDYLSVYSNQCFWKEVEAEAEALNKEMAEIVNTIEKHIDTFAVRVEALSEEFYYNYEAIKKGKIDKLNFSFLEGSKKVTTSIECIDTIYPAMYNNMDAVAIITMSGTSEKQDVLVTVEVEDFTLKYEKTFTIGVTPERYYVKPAVISGINLDNQKNTQIKVTVSSVEDGSIIQSETKNVKLMSINDFILSNDEFGYSNRADILAWVTPESTLIQKVLRNAATYMKLYKGVEMIPGYQYVRSDMDETNTTAFQAFAIQKAISELGVRYVMSSYSIGEAENATQRVNRPDETLTSKSGICIETAVLMASALQAAGMDAMIVLTTGHCQVAVETWADSGKYILIETTILPLGDPGEQYGEKNYLNSLLKVYSNEDWKKYLSERNGEVYDCDLATELGITPLIY